MLMAYNTARTRRILGMLLEGSVTGSMVQRTEPAEARRGIGIEAMRRLARDGLVERVYTGDFGPKEDHRFTITAAGRELAKEWDIVSVHRRGECCEAAIFGIEGEHDPYPVCAASVSSPV